MCKQCFKQSTSSTKDGASLGIDMSGIVADNGPDGSICAATSNHKRGRKTITLHHHVFSNGGGWQQRRSLPQPTVSLTAYACKEDYEHFGMPLSSYPRGGQVTAIADTGCQSCLIGQKMVYRLGFKQADLLPVEHKMSTANRQAIEITGAVILRLRGADSGGYPIESTQICYVTPESETCSSAARLAQISASFHRHSQSLVRRCR